MLTLKAPAKINWFLKVYGLRSDGYHEIKSLIQKINLFDTLSFSFSEELTLSTNLHIPHEQNLVYKAAVLLQRKCGINTGAKICLKKDIPVSAGLGGGSSDAASALLGLNKLWSLGLNEDELSLFAGELGSDVPFFLQGPLAFAEGRGEKITPCRAVNSLNILVVKPNIAVSTQWAYGQLRKRMQNTEYRTQSTDNPPSPPFSKGGMGGFGELTRRTDTIDNIKLYIHAIENAELKRDSFLQNDLESVIIKFYPLIAKIKNRLLEEGAVFAIMSGSGPTVFGVFDSVKKAFEASKVFKNYWTAVVQTVTN